VNLADGGAPKPGLYVIRLTQEQPEGYSGDGVGVERTRSRICRAPWRVAARLPGSAICDTRLPSQFLAGARAITYDSVRSARRPTTTLRGTRDGCPTENKRPWCSRFDESDESGSNAKRGGRPKSFIRWCAAWNRTPTY